MDPLTTSLMISSGANVVGDVAGRVFSPVQDPYALYMNRRREVAGMGVPGYLSDSDIRDIAYSGAAMRGVGSVAQAARMAVASGKPAIHAKRERIGVARAVGAQAQVINADLKIIDAQRRLSGTRAAIGSLATRTAQVAEFKNEMANAALASSLATVDAQRARRVGISGAVGTGLGLGAMAWQMGLFSGAPGSPGVPKIREGFQTDWKPSTEVVA